MSEMLKESIRNLRSSTITQYWLEDFAVKLIEPQIDRLRGTAIADAYEIGRQWHLASASFVDLRNAYHKAWAAKNDNANADDFTRYVSRAVAILLGWMHSSDNKMQSKNYYYVIVRFAYLVAKAASDGDEAKLIEVERQQLELFREMVTSKVK